VLNPEGASTGTVALAVSTFTDVTGSIAPGGASVPVTIAAPGQNALLTFIGAAGQRIAALVSNATFPRYCYNFGLSILKPDGSTLASTASCWTDAVIDTQILPISGAYSIRLDPDGASTGSATITLTTP
jgi:hypothetical protein